MDDFVAWLEQQLVDAAGRPHPHRTRVPDRLRSSRPSLGGLLVLGGALVAVAVAVLAIALPSHRHQGSAATAPQTIHTVARLQQNIEKLQAALATARWRAVSASVTSRTGPSPTWPYELEVDKGSAAGVRVNDAALGDGALVGRVTAVGSDYAFITLITRPGSSVEALVEDAGGDTGVLVGRGLVRTHLLLSHVRAVNHDAPEPRLGQLVVSLAVSDGSRGLRPAGIPIGQVSNISPALYSHHEVGVSPGADLGHLATVRILVRPPKPSALTASPPASQLVLLGVLRRPTNPYDQSYVDRGLSQLFGGIHGIERPYVRLLYRSARLGGVLLIPARSWSEGGSTINNPLCVVSVPPSGRGSGGSCEPTSALTSGHLTGSSGTLGYSVVPDGVAKVILRFAHAPSQTVPVHNNFVLFSATRLTRPGGAPEQPSSIQWLDSRGHPVPLSSR